MTVNRGGSDLKSEEPQEDGDNDEEDNDSTAEEDAGTCGILFSCVSTFGNAMNSFPIGREGLRVTILMSLREGYNNALCSLLISRIVSLLQRFSINGATSACIWSKV